MICSKCQQTLPDDSKFCPYCGFNISSNFSENNLKAIKKSKEFAMDSLRLRRIRRLNQLSVLISVLYSIVCTAILSYSAYLSYSIKKFIDFRNTINSILIGLIIFSAIVLIVFIIIAVVTKISESGLYEKNLYNYFVVKFANITDTTSSEKDLNLLHELSSIVIKSGKRIQISFMAAALSACISIMTALYCIFKSIPKKQEWIIPCVVIFLILSVSVAVISAIIYFKDRFVSKDEIMLKKLDNLFQNNKNK